jgi:hypothetical protein
MESSQSTNFIPRRTLISAAWLNWVDSLVESGQYAPISVVPANVSDHTEQLDALFVEVAEFVAAQVVPGRVTIDGGGLTYYVSDPLSYANLPNTSLQNFIFVAIGSSWTSNRYILKTNTSSNGCKVTKCFFDCNKKSSGLQVDTPKAIVSLCEVVRWVANGTGMYLSDGGNGVRLLSNDVHQWANADAELLSTSNWSGNGIYVNSHDVKVLDCRSYWTAIPFRIGADGNACEVGGKSHFYNGNSDIIPLDQTVVQVDAGGGCKFNDCYIGNGIIKLYATGCHFNGTRVQYDKGSNADMSSGRAFIEVYADGKSGPRNMQTSTWMASSADLKNGTVPFIKFLPYLSNTWSGDWTYINGQNGPKNISSRMIFVNPRDEDDGYSAIAFLSPSTDPTNSPTRISLGDGTSTAALDALGGLGSFGNFINIFNELKRFRNITADGSTSTLSSDDSGKVVVVASNPTTHTVRLSDTNPAGWFATIARRGSNNVSVTLKSGAAGAGKGITFPLTLAADYDSVNVLCYENLTGTAAKYIIAWGV